MRNIYQKIKDAYRRIAYIASLVIKACPILLVAIFICTLLLGILPVINSIVTARILNHIVYSGYSENLSNIVYLIATKALLLLFTNIANYSNTTLLTFAGSQVTNYIRKAIIEKAKEIDLADYDSPAFYSKLENAKKEASSRPVAVVSAVFGLISTLLSLIAYISILSRFSIGIVVIVVLIGIPQCVFTHIYRKKTYLYNLSSTGIRRQMTYYNSIVTEPKISKEIRLYGLFDWFRDKYTSTFKQYFHGLKSITLAEFKWEILLSIMSAITIFGIYLYTAFKALTGAIVIGNFTLYTNALSSISSLMLSLFSHMAAIYSGTLFVDNLYIFLNRKRCLKVADEEYCINFGTSHTIEFANVSFSYPGCTNKVLKNISFTVRTGEKLVIVGLNGSGKTTLIKLLLRLYDPTEGVIYLDGHDIRQYSTTELYKLYSAVFQDYGKFADTIEKNIAFGDIDRPVNMNELSQSAVKGQAYDFIKGTSSSFDTPLSKLFYDNGIELSTGQWQRIAISRAFYRNADICIWDEPTASLDSLSEKALMDLIMTDNPSTITILISHRLLFSEKANQIIVLESGRIKERGTHEELINLHGIYEKLATKHEQHIDEN